MNLSDEIIKNFTQEEYLNNRKQIKDFYKKVRLEERTKEKSKKNFICTPV